MILALPFRGGPKTESRGQSVTPAAVEAGNELIGKWIAIVDDEIVATGGSMQEVVQAAEDEGYDQDEIVVEKVAPPGTYIL